MKNKNILIGLGVVSIAAILYIFVFKKQKKASDKILNQDDLNTNVQDSKNQRTEELKSQINQLSNQLLSPEMKGRWGQDDYVSIQKQITKLIKELDRLGWRTVSNQSNNFQIEFIKK
jgi:uncharacterized protein YlxW (UPF0749 family)